MRSIYELMNIHDLQALHWMKIYSSNRGFRFDVMLTKEHFNDLYRQLSTYADGHVEDTENFTDVWDFIDEWLEK